MLSNHVLSVVPAVPPNPANPPTFADLLVTVPARERAGGRSANRLTFQQSWGLKRICELHDESVNDYCVLFDVHEDIVVLDSPENPTRSDLYQVKTKTTAGAWTPHALTVREKSKDPLEEKPSIIGKLYLSRLQFGDFVASMSFVTNANFSFTLSSPPPCTERESFCMTDVADDERNDMAFKVSTEHKVADPPDGFKHIFFIRTDLSVNDHDTHMVGILADFLKTHADETVPPGPFHRTLKSEIRRRNDKELANQTFGELVKKRGLSRKAFQAMLDGVKNQTKMDDLRSMFNSQATKDGMLPRRLSALTAEIRNFLAERLDETNLVLVEAWNRVKRDLDPVVDAHFAGGGTIEALIQQIIANGAKEFFAVRQRYSETFLHALIAVAIYDNEPTVPTVSTQPEEEKP